MKAYFLLSLCFLRASGSLWQKSMHVKKFDRMEKIYILIGVMLLCLSPDIKIYAQVEHNYHVVSGFTDCDSLMLKGLDKDEALKLLQNTRFRYQQEFRLTRREGLKTGAFYSCDGKQGYLAVTYDGKKYLYVNVPLENWEQFTKSTDPERYFLNNVRDKFSQDLQ